MSNGKWMDTLYENVGNNVHLETTDGIHREGRMSGLRMRDLKLDGEMVEMITELELNGDPTDTVDLSRISSIDFG